MLFYLMAVSCYTTNPYSMYSGFGYNLYSGPYLGVTTNNLPVINSPSNTQPNNTNNSTILQENHQREKCWNCHGKGRVIKDINVATFGNDEKKWCQECQSWYYRSNAHTHVNCSICHGTGYVK